MRHIRFAGYTTALAISIALFPVSAFAANPVNTVNNGPVVSGGAYFNTPDGETRFTNTAGGGLWLKSGSNIRAVEVNSSGIATNNGGTVHFFAPGQVVRLDGNIDVRAVRDSFDAYRGNGGNVFVDSAYLYQNGNIYANGINGGLVQFNVGSATLANTARIEAKGSGLGVGGTIAINASGAVDLQRQTVLDTTGGVAGTIDTNVINIEGGLVNVEGLLQARGLVYRGDNIGPGGTIRLVGSGQTDLNQTQSALANAVTAGNLTASEASAINTRLSSLKSSSDGDVTIAAASGQQPQATLYAVGGFGSAHNNDPTDPSDRSGDGGTIIITAQRNINNGGWLIADGGDGTGRGPNDAPGDVYKNGGNGGTINLNAGQSIVNSGRMTSDGGNGGLSIDFSQGRKGGDGGLIALSYGDQMQNSGVIKATGGQGAPLLGESPVGNGNGGNGGLVVFSGLANPSLNGTVVTYGGPPGGPGGSYGQLGSVVAPNPATSTNTLIGVWRNTQPIELLSHNENILLLINRKANPFLHAPDGYPFDLPDYLSSYTYNAQLRSVQDQAGEAPGQLSGTAMNEFLSKLQQTGDSPSGNYLYRNMVFANSTDQHVYFYPSAFNRGVYPFSTSLAPFNTLTLLSAGNIDGGTHLQTFGNGPGGGHFSSISPYLLGDVYVNGGIGGGSVHIATTDQAIVTAQSQNSTLHGGSDIIKTPGRISILGYAQFSGGLAGGNQQLLAGTVVSNGSGFGGLPLTADGGTFGGSILIKGPDHILNGAAPIEANGGDYGGVIRLQTNAPIITNGPIQATGGIQNGQVITEPSP
jgi:hypothetical protein